MKTINEYAMDILKEHGCDEYTYGGNHDFCKPERIAEDLKTAYPNGMAYPYMDVANAIREISNLKAKEVPQEGFDFEDWGKWGIGDFYEDHENELRTAIASGKPFSTGWHGWRETEYTLSISRGYDVTMLDVWDCMDEAFDQFDLFADFLTSEECKMLTNEKLKEIRDDLVMGDFCEETGYTEYLPLTATFDEIMEKASEMIEECENRLNEFFGECIATTLYVLYGDSEETMKLIENRKRECGVKEEE